MQRKTIIIGGAIVGGVLFFVLAAAALVSLSFTGVSSRDVREDERHMLVTINDLAPYATIPGDRSLCESYIAKRNVDGSLEVEYKYDTDEDPEAEEFLLLKSETETSGTVRLAKESFANRVAAYKMGASLVSGGRLQEDSSLFSLGEDNFAAISTLDGDVIGNIVVTRKGNVVYSLLIYGLYLDEREQLESLLKPTMR